MSYKIRTLEVQKSFESGKKKLAPRKLLEKYVKKLQWPSKDGWRWPVQESVSACILYIIFVIINPTSNFFEEACLSALVSFPVTLDTTAGGSLRRNTLYLVIMTVFSTLAVGLYFLIFLGHDYANFMSISTTIGAAFLPMPAILIRGLYPTAILGLTSGVSIGEHVLLGSFVKNSFPQALLYTGKLILAVLISCVVVATVAHVIIPRKARSTISNSLADVMEILADILDPVVSSGSVLHKSSLHALLTPYPHIQNAIVHCFHSCTDIQELTKPPKAARVQKNFSLRDLNELSKPLDKQPQTTKRKLNIFNIAQKESSHDDTEDMTEGYLKDHYSKLFEIYSTECSRMLKEINKCNLIFENQVELFVAANREFNCMSLRSFMFPRIKYKNLLEEMKTLYIHISCFVYTLDLGLKSAKECFLNDIDFSTTNITIPYQLSSLSSSSLSNRADLYAFDRNLAYGGDQLHEVTYYIVKALRNLSKTLKTKSKVSESTLNSINAVKNSLARLSTHRYRQHEEFANIVFQCFQSDISHEWNPKIELNWKMAFCIDIETFRKMSEEEKAAFWENYWLGRDRLSLVEQTLYAVYDNLRNVAQYINEYVTAEG